MSTGDDLVKWASMYHLLVEQEGFRLWWVHPNGARAPGAKMHEALRRLPYNPHPWERGPPPQAWEIGLRRGAGAAGSVHCPNGRAYRRSHPGA